MVCLVPREAIYKVSGSCNGMTRKCCLYMSVACSVTRLRQLGISGLLCCEADAGNHGSIQSTDSICYPRICRTSNVMRHHYLHGRFFPLESICTRCLPSCFTVTTPHLCHHRLIASTWVRPCLSKPIRAASTTVCCVSICHKHP